MNLGTMLLLLALGFIITASLFDHIFNNGAIAKSQQCADDFNAGRDMQACYTRMEHTT